MAVGKGGTPGTSFFRRGSRRLGLSRDTVKFGFVGIGLFLGIPDYSIFVMGW
ncbi:MAG: hypothetical protein GXX84_01800 [Acidobacteria bacterium]|nr:hypothetical protein [Acidobacteriota bacterium]